MKKILMVGFYRGEFEALVRHLEATGYDPAALKHLKEILEDK